MTLDDTVGQGQKSEFVQISPQRIHLKLRRGEKTKISFKVAHAKKYPVDLYYLMDLSNSMQDDRETVVSRLNLMKGVNCIDFMDFAYTYHS